MNPRPGPPRCALCAEPTLAFWRRHRGYDLWRCGGCGIAQVHPLPTDAELACHYDRNFFTGDVSRYGYMDYAAERPYMEKNYRHKLARLRPHLGPGRRTLDVGCAYGFWLDWLGPEWERTGVELCPEAAAHGRDELGLTVATGELTDPTVAARGPYDLITMWDVLDHLRDPVAALRTVRGLLAPGGLFVFNLGDLDSRFARLTGRYWYLLIPPTHLFYFTRKAVTAFLEREGFAVEKIETEGKFFFVSLCFFRLQYLLPGAVTRWCYRLISRSPLGSLAVHLNFGDLLTVYARTR